MQFSDFCSLRSSLRRIDMVSRSSVQTDYGVCSFLGFSPTRQITLKSKCASKCLTYSEGPIGCSLLRFGQWGNIAVHDALSSSQRYRNSGPKRTCSVEHGFARILSHVGIWLLELVTGYSSRACCSMGQGSNRF